MQRFEKYSGYKDSGVDWLGEIPAGWDIKRMKYIGKISSGDAIVNSQLKDEGLYEVFGGNGLIGFTDRFNITGQKIIIGRVGALCGNVRYSETNRWISDNALILSLRKGVQYSFFKILLESANLNKLNTSNAQPLITGAKVMNFEIPLPPLPEQTAIANFLDEKTNKIDTAITQKEQMISLLKERKQILIQNAVIKGIDPAVKMKDSGVDWIGEIPDGWEVKAIKHIANLQSGETISPEKFTEEGYPVFGGNGFRGYTDRYTNDGLFSLIGRQGALCGNVNYTTGKFYASEHAIVVYPKHNENTLWLGEIIKVANLNRLSQSSAQPGIAVGVVKNVFFPYPSVEEQHKIADFIKTESAKIDTSITLQQQQITKLKEYKSILIDHAVTGKIKVA